ncbi:MAG: hypothetical protein JWQ06_192 [Mucilaginibacter sp.]|nr:hypothetical protein [Mucilaginibacter sp.]
MFNKILTCCILLCAICGSVFSQNIPPELYKSATIPDSLKENANSVVRYSDYIMTVKGRSKINIRQHTIVTILNEKADRDAVLQLFYNRKYDNYSNIEMRVYNEKGDLIKKYHKSDMYDGSATHGEDLITDERFLGVKHTVSAYPITIETSYDEDMTSALDLGRWEIQHKEQAVQNATYAIIIDDNAGLRYLNKNILIKPVKTSENNISHYVWKVSNLKAIKLEEGAVAWRVLPKIYFASNSFEFYGNPGDFSTWNDYGKWQQALNADVSSLSPQREEEIRKMTDSIKTDKGKAKFLYTYIQQNMRYVSVQLGIGGLKPFPAMFVDQKKYGDCKALSNYMSALLKAVHIPSYYALINAGTNQEPADPSFPNDPFNHVILCVPFKGDTTWLECTSSTQPFGQLGTFTENRTALIVTENGGKLINTPRSTMQDNQFNSEVHLILNADGGAKAELKVLSTGGYREEYVGLESLKLDEQKQAFMGLLNLKQPSVFDVTPSSDKDGIKRVNINLEYDKFCDVMAGDKQFYRPHVFDLCAFTVPEEEKRKTDYYFEHPMQKSCVTIIDLPAGYEIETLPANQTLKFTYGNYEVAYTYDATKNQVVSTAKFNLTNYVIPAARYTELQQYLDAVAKAQNKKLVIKRKA